MRTPDEILRDLDFAANMIPVRELLHEVLQDICNSFDLAMTAENVDVNVRMCVNLTVSDYIANHYGDD